MADSVILMGYPVHYFNKPTTYVMKLRQLFMVSPKYLICRIFESFIPPFNKKYQRVYIDLLGPLLATIMLMSFVTYGNSLRQVRLNLTPIEFILMLSVLMPLLCFSMCILGKSKITLYETVCLVGYAFYGHLLTLLVSFIFFQEESNFFFFVSLIFFGGSSTLRLALVFLSTIPVPAAQLLICTTISVVNLLSLIFLHFAFMHRTFVYKSAN